MPIQGLKFNINTGTEGHQSFQATGSFTAYNPNDGYTLLALDRTATLLDYDHKLPSQSGGHFPGPINSYLSMYYVDQSGSGVSGQIIVYASPDTIQIPRFWSIGRAIQTQVTALDIQQGAQPGNPPALVTRLWSDSQGHLNLLHSDGTNYNVLDTNNAPAFIGSQILGGDLAGTINNGSVVLQWNHTISLKDIGGTSHSSIAWTGDNWIEIQNGTNGFLFANSANTVRIWQIDNNGTVTQTGDLHAKDIYASRGDGTGVFYAASGGGIYLYWNGSNWLIAGGGVTIPGGNLLVSSGYFYGTNTNNAWLLDGGNTTGYVPGDYYFRKTGGGSYADLFAKYIHLTDGTNGVIYCDTGSLFFRSSNNFYYFDSGTYPNGSVYVATTLNIGLQNANQYRVELPNTAGKAGQILANAFATYSSVEHARAFGLPISEIEDPIGKLHGVKPLYYKHATITEDGKPVQLKSGELEASYTYGFSAQDMQSVAPELVGLSPEGDPIAIAYDRLTALLWAAVQDIEKRLVSAGF